MMAAPFKCIRASRFFCCLVFAVACLFFHSAHAEKDEIEYGLHALAMHGQPLYPPDFKQLDYVEPSAPKGGELKLSKGGAFDNLNNSVITGTVAEGLEYLNAQLMQRTWNEPFTLYGLVAGTVDVAKDRSSITYHLRPEAKFHDGQPMTAADVNFSFEKLKTYGHPVRRRVYGLVDQVEMPDDRTITFHFGKGYDRESVMILSLLPVLPKHYWEKHDISKTTLEPPVGSGPYQITQVDAGRKIVYARIKDWWGADLPVNRGLYNFDRLVYTYYRDDDIALQAFKAGDFDLRREYDISKWEGNYQFKALADGRVKKEEIAHHRPEWLRAMIFNTRRPLFADRNVRKALGLMLNDQWLNANLFDGGMNRIESAFPNSTLAAQGPPDAQELAVLKPFEKDLPPEVFGDSWHAPSGSMRDRQRQADALLKAAGWQFRNLHLVDKDGKPFSFEILLGDPNDEKIALEFTRSLKRLGIDARVRTVDSAQFTGRLEDYDYDMVFFRWINSLSPGNEQVNYWGSVSGENHGGRNYAGIRNPAVDSLADSIARSETREGLVTRCHALDRVLMHENYMIPLFYLGRDLVAYRSDIKHPDKMPLYGMVLESWWRQ